MDKNEDLHFLDKIKELFEYRGIPELFSIGGITDAAFEENLLWLQSSIYDLDNYLETTWDLSENKIGELWESIKHRLSPFVKDPSSHEGYLYQIKIYLNRETGLRSGHYPLNTSLKYFYYYKSCDVRLIRQLIYEHCQTNRTFLKPSNWHIFDLVTEVNDDVDDVFEDLEIFNCNRLLFEAYFNGLEVAERCFRKFLLSLQTLNHGRSGTQATATEEVIQSTLVLLGQRVNSLREVDFQKTRLFSKVGEK